MEELKILEEFILPIPSYNDFLKNNKGQYASTIMPGGVAQW